MFNIVLLEPEMPANTGNIGRTCCATGTKLHLIEPMGFRVNDKMVKRAGLDYWNDLDVQIYSCYSDFLDKNPAAAEKMYMATTKSRHDYTEVNYEPGSYIMFGKESAGIPEEILVNSKETAIRSPMNRNKRCQNLSNSLAIILYEALRQNKFNGMQMEGKLHRLDWN